MATSSIFTDPVYKGEEEITAFLDALEASKARAHTIPKPKKASPVTDEEIKSVVGAYLDTLTKNHA